ncbi:MAG: ATP-grasp domain-containing protein [Desulfarculales bacterium]|jgi:acetyl-CoA carboxylase biotin carboxylase subunit|nr:ATP-grasp domain-containing protein [Desulfarculales bacterium]
MFQSLLIANRGEIAIRVIRACRDLGIKAIAVYSAADADSLHVRLADQAIPIGPPQAELSYLNPEAIIKAAKEARAGAIHPGYGFLSESPLFAQMVIDAGFVWIGPRPGILQHAGDKDAARATMQRAGMPMTEGSDILHTVPEALSWASKLGYPVILKPSSGGGGKSMYVANSPTEFEAILTRRVDISKISFYLEQYIAHARHIEVQIMADNYGHVVHLGERECSLQRMNQKILEETPSLALTPQMRQEVTDLGVRVARHMNYNSVGTVEFLFDVDRHKFYFLEVNPRIQVEHGISEWVTGVDIARHQITIAQGRPLELLQADIKFSGHALECRINAEDPRKKFIPSPGRISFVNLPGGPQVRVDSSIVAGGEVPPFYDSLIAKVMVRGANRGEAILVMRRALEEFIVEGVKTTISLHQRIMADKDFMAGNFSTRYVEEKFINNRR